MSNNRPFAKVEMGLPPNTEDNPSEKWVNKELGVVWHRKSDEGVVQTDSPYKNLNLVKTVVTQDDDGKNVYTRHKAVSIAFEDGTTVSLEGHHLTLKVSDLFKRDAGGPAPQDEFDDNSIPF